MVVKTQIGCAPLQLILSWSSLPAVAATQPLAVLRVSASEHDSLLHSIVASQPKPAAAHKPFAHRPLGHKLTVRTALLQSSSHQPDYCVP